MFIDIDITKEPQKIELYLAKPDRTVIAKLSDAYEVTNNTKLGQVNELNFKLPYFVEVNHNLERYRHIDKVRVKYLIKVMVGLKVDWYIITGLTDTSTDSEDYMSVTCFYLPYEMNDKLIKGYKPNVQDDGTEVPCNPSYILDDILVKSQNITKQIYDADSNGEFWKKGYVDATLDEKFRLFDIDSSTLLDTMFQFAETFNALIIWDTDKREINLYDPDNIGQNRGLQLSYQKYLQSVSKEKTTDEMVTRLKVSGQDNLTINSVNPTGTSYLEDFSFYMYPFQRDADRNVISSSYYMSDSLCHAILDYNEKIEGSRGDFSNLLLQKSGLETQLTTKQNELTTLQTQLVMKQDELDVAMSKGDDTTLIQSQIDQINYDITQKQNEIATIETSINDVDIQIANTGSSLAVENNFTMAQMRERNRFIAEKEWTSAISDEQELFDEAVRQFEKMKEPKTVINMDIVNFLEIVECQRDWDKLQLGDIVTIKYDNMGIDVEAKIIEINFDYGQGNINLTIANETELLSDEEKLIKMIYSAGSTSATVDANKYKWDESQKNKSDISKIIDQLQGNIVGDINLAVNDYVTFNNRGLTITSPQNPLEFLRATHGILAITNDGGNTYKNAITTKGVVADNLYGRIIAGTQLYISNENNSFRLDNNGIEVNADSFIVKSGTGSNIVDDWNASTDFVNNLIYDGAITPYEKKLVKDRWNNINTRYNSNITRWDYYYNGVDPAQIPTDIDTYKTYYQELYNYLFVDLQSNGHTLLDETIMLNSTNIDEATFNTRFKNYEDKEVDIERIISIKAKDMVDNTQSQITQMESEVVYKVELISTRGFQFSNGQINTTMTAIVYRGQTDITSTIPDSGFIWTKFDKDGISDSVWNNAHVNVGNSINITSDDVFRKAIFECAIDIA